MAGNKGILKLIKSDKTPEAGDLYQYDGLWLVSSYIPGDRMLYARNSSGMYKDIVTDGVVLLPIVVSDEPVNNCKYMSGQFEVAYICDDCRINLNQGECAIHLTRQREYNKGIVTVEGNKIIVKSEQFSKSILEQIVKGELKDDDLVEVKENRTLDAVAGPYYQVVNTGCFEITKLQDIVCTEKQYKQGCWEAYKEAARLFSEIDDTELFRAEFKDWFEQHKKKQ